MYITRYVYTVVIKVSKLFKKVNIFVLRVQSWINHVETNTKHNGWSLINPYLPQISHRSLSARLKSNYFPTNCYGCCFWTSVPKSNNQTMSWQRTCPNLKSKILNSKISLTDNHKRAHMIGLLKNHRYRICILSKE